MTPEEQRIAIALACGAEWRCNGFNNYFISFEGDGFTPLNTYGERCEDWDQFLPKYLNDLNVMHEAVTQTLTYKPESVIGRSTLTEYEDHLIKICGGCRLAIHATADQRAEAFLKTLSLWKD